MSTVCLFLSWGKGQILERKNGVHVRRALYRASCFMRPRSKSVAVYNVQLKIGINQSLV